VSTKHLDILGLLLMASGLLEFIEGTVFGLGVLIAWGLGSTEVMAMFLPEAVPVSGAFEYVPLVTGTLILVLGVVFGGVQGVAGYGIYKRLPWGRVAGIVACIIVILDPLRVLLAIYGLVVLFNGGLKSEFASEET
jgi:hypothetical protein